MMMKTEVRKISEFVGRIEEASNSPDGPGGELTVEGLDDVLTDIVNDVNDDRDVERWYDTDITVKVTVEVVKVEDAKDDDGPLYIFGDEK